VGENFAKIQRRPFVNARGHSLSGIFGRTLAISTRLILSPHIPVPVVTLFEMFLAQTLGGYAETWSAVRTRLSTGNFENTLNQESTLCSWRKELCITEAKSRIGCQPCL
jgi:hypothetical protein